VSLKSLGFVLTELMRAKNWVYASLAKASGTDPAYVRRLLEGIQLGSLESLDKVAQALNADTGILVNVYLGRLTPEEAFSANMVVPLPEELDINDKEEIVTFIDYLIFKKLSMPNAGEKFLPSTDGRR
jgi:transcriptional regulator with XRE-family HTH domain